MNMENWKGEKSAFVGLLLFFFEVFLYNFDEAVESHT